MHQIGCGPWLPTFGETLKWIAVKTVVKRKKKSPSSNRAAPGSGRPMTARAVAELCGVELKTVHNWALEGRLAHFRTPGRHLRFPPEAVETFLRECGYADAKKERPSVVCLSFKPTTRLRRLLGASECIWTSDLWSALVEVGRTAPDVFLIDGSQLATPGLTEALRTVKRLVPAVNVIVLGAVDAALAAAGVRAVTIDGLPALLA